MGKFRWWKCSLRHCSVLDENRLKRRKKNSAAAITFFKLTLMSGDSSTTTMGSLGCGSGRTVTVRILELITAGGLQRHAQSHGQKQKKSVIFYEPECILELSLNFSLGFCEMMRKNQRNVPESIFWHSSHTSTLGMYDNIGTPATSAWNKPLWPTNGSLIICMQPDKLSLIKPSESVHTSRRNRILIPPSEGLFFFSLQLHK